MLHEPSELEILINKTICWMFGCSYYMEEYFGLCTRCGGSFIEDSDRSGPRILRKYPWWYTDW